MPSGGSFIIPSAYGYEGFNLGGMATASGGETVTVGKGGNTGANITIIYKPEIGLEDEYHIASKLRPTILKVIRRWEPLDFSIELCYTGSKGAIMNTQLTTYLDYQAVDRAVLQPTTKAKYKRELENMRTAGVDPLDLDALTTYADGLKSSREVVFEVSPETDKP